VIRLRAGSLPVELSEVSPVAESLDANVVKVRGMGKGMGSDDGPCPGCVGDGRITDSDEPGG
jgi:hypothetical protein